MSAIGLSPSQYMHHERWYTHFSLSEYLQHECWKTLINFSQCALWATFWWSPRTLQRSSGIYMSAFHSAITMIPGLHQHVLSTQALLRYSHQPSTLYAQSNMCDSHDATIVYAPWQVRYIYDIYSQSMCHESWVTAMCPQQYIYHDCWIIRNPIQKNIHYQFWL